MQKTILVIDDDDKLRELLAEYFLKFEIDCRGASSPAEGMRLLKQYQPSLVILDVMLPGKDGFEVCRDIRKTSSVPVIMLTARGDVTDRIVGLEIGADDYLAKPFEPRELLARVQTVLRRAEGSLTTPSLEFENLKIDINGQRVEVEGETIQLSSLEFEALHLFARNAGKVLSRETILGELKGLDLEAFDRSIDVLVSRLRHKLRDDPKAPVFLKTIRSKGYLFTPGRPEKKSGT